MIDNRELAGLAAMRFLSWFDNYDLRDGGPGGPLRAALLDRLQHEILLAIEVAERHWQNESKTPERTGNAKLAPTTAEPDA